METAKQLMKSGDVRGAAERLKAILAVRPSDAETLMLYGTCCHLLGDDETFKRIHDKLAPKMAAVADGETQGLWRKYHKLWVALMVGGLVLAGITASAVYFGKAVNSQCNVAYGVAIVTNPYNETNVHNAVSAKEAESHANKFKDVRSDAESW